MFDRQTANAINQSVQTALVNTTKPAMQTSDSWEMFVVSHPDILATWNSFSRRKQLRVISYAIGNGLFQGAAAGLIMRWQTVPWEIKGGKNLVRFYQEMLARNWDKLIGQTGWDFLTQDVGAFIEVVGGGRADKPLTGRVMMLDHLDSLSCYATKNAEFPVVYWNEEDGSMHHLHDSRVQRFVDMMSPQRTAYGTGLCALSRYISEANVDILLGRHDNEMLNDLPPAGLLGITGVHENQWVDILSKFESDRRADGQNVFRNTMVMFNTDPTAKVEIQLTPFSTMPEGFDTKGFIDVHVNKLALALGVDPQDIWPLSGQALGTGTQSEILASKARGKMFGRFLQMITRFINYKVLPDGLEFQFKFKDAEEDSEQANTAKVWVDIANSATFLSDEEKRDLLAQQVEAIRDVITDENGEVVALPDDDPKTDDQEVIAPDDNPLATVSDQPDVPANLQSEDVAAGLSDDRGANGAVPAVPKVPNGSKSVGRRQGLLLDRGHDSDGTGRKDYPATKDAFVEEVAAAISDAADGTISPASFAIRVRASLSKYGRNAYLDGLSDGGVETSTLEGEDSDAYAAILADQSTYVTDARRGITDFSGDAESRAQLWGNKSLELFYQAGVMSADRNGLYEWVYGDTEHCDDCQRLNGQKHRMKDWVAKDWLPKSSRLDCHGFRCACSLKKTTGRAKGSY